MTSEELNKKIAAVQNDLTDEVAIVLLERVRLDVEMNGIEDASHTDDLISLKAYLVASSRVDSRVDQDVFDIVNALGGSDVIVEIDIWAV